MLKFPFLQFLLCILAVLGLAACNSDSTEAVSSDTVKTTTTTTSSTNTSTLTVEFKGMVNDQDFVCGGTYSPVGGTAQDSYKVNDFRVYLSGFKLFNQHTSFYDEFPLVDDGKWQTANVVLLDFENGCLNGTPDTNTQVKLALTTDKNVSDYNGICFTLGLPFDENHGDPAVLPSPLNVSGMLWSWTTGRKFIRIDGVADPDNLNSSFVMHLGSTGCSDVNKQGKQPDGPCSYPNTPEICLSNFDPANQMVKVDIAQILKESNLVYNTPDTAIGCMSGNNDPECQTILPLLGIDFTYEDGVNPPIVFPKKEQKFFTVQ